MPGWDPYLAPEPYVLAFITAFGTLALLAVILTCGPAITTWLETRRSLRSQPVISTTGSKDECILVVAPGEYLVSVKPDGRQVWEPLAKET